MKHVKINKGLMFFILNEAGLNKGMYTALHYKGWIGYA